MKNDIIPALRITLVCMVLFCCIYTLFILGVAQLAPGHGEGRTITANDRVYYENVGQSFTDDRYFNSRPSAVAYNAAGSAGSNKGPSNPEYLKQVNERIDTLLAHNPGVNRADIPSEMVTASGSGLDPDISVRSAMLQARRIAKARQLPEATVARLVARCTEHPWMGLFGPEKINVLKINIALDKTDSQ
jgi:potassium-transporting ATPase KdpC subunit